MLIFLTSVDYLPAYSQHYLTIPGSVGHQIQHLLMRPTFHHHSINANELISSSQPAILLCSSVGHDGSNVDLGKYILREGLQQWYYISLAHGILQQECDRLTGCCGPSPPRTRKPKPVSMSRFRKTSMSLVWGSAEWVKSCHSLRKE